jgi:hypothetical protein
MLKNIARHIAGMALAIGLAFALGGCTKQTNQPDELRPIYLKLVFGSEGRESRSPASEGRQPVSLAKSTRLVEDQVLMLHCDETTLSLASDATGYHNDFSLYYIKRDSSASTALKQALVFDGATSYGLCNSYSEAGAELSGTHGFSLSFRMMLTGTATTGEQRIFDRHDSLGGYTIGTLVPGGILGYTPRLYLRIKQDGTETTLVSKSDLVNDRWYKVTARYDQSNLTLLLDDKTDTTRAATGLVSPSTHTILLGAGWSDDLPAYHFQGRLDEISLTTKVDYLDLDRIRVAVMDLSAFGSEEEYYRDLGWRYQQATYKMISDSTFSPTWERYVQLWDHVGFKRAFEQDLVINGGFAEGTLRGVEGMNLIYVGALQDGLITYSGEGMVFVTGGEPAVATITLWKHDTGFID